MSEYLLRASCPWLILSRFGNFIGEANESEDESEQEENGRNAYYLEDEARENEPANDQQLMEIDGCSLLLSG